MLTKHLSHSMDNEAICPLDRQCDWGGPELCSTYTVMQCMYLYLPLTYPKYSASLFAANDLARSSFAVGAILFSRPMFLTLTVPSGVSLLGGLTVIRIEGTFLLYFYGAAMRARSRFAVG